MKYAYKKILILTLIMGCSILEYSNAYAAHKLDFFTQLEELGKQIQTKKSEIEKKYNSTMSDLKEKVEKASGAEGAALFSLLQKELEGTTSGIVDNVKNQSINNIDLGSAIRSATSNYANLQLSATLATNALTDYKQAVIKEREEQKKEIEAKIAAVDEKLKTIDDGDMTDNLAKEKDNLAKERADLVAQLTEIERKASARDETAEALAVKAKVAAKKANDAQAYVQEEKWKSDLNKEVDSLFEGTSVEEQESEESLAEMYGADINEFFLGKYEYLSSDNMARVRTNRQKEYYRSLQNLMRVIMIGAGKGQEIADTADTYLQKTSEVDGIFGGNAMKIGVEIQKAKVAARYAELLLAEIRFNSVAEMNSWTDKYKNNKQDVTKFNLDDYVYKKKSLKDKLNEKIQSGISNWKGL